MTEQRSLIKDRGVRIFVHSLVILALVFSTISPACAFVSGKMSLIEICGADGSLKTVSVPDTLNPLASSEQKTAPVSDESQLSARCAFCLAFSSLKAMVPDFSVIRVVLYAAETVLENKGSLFSGALVLLGFSPTGPPGFIFM